jgi:cyclopropane fatty-acyl-phospholipid synthase-like methyltransferase
MQVNCRIAVHGRYALVKQRFAGAGLSDRIKIRLTNYSNVKGSYDKIVPIEMLEAVGDQFLKPYFKEGSRTPEKQNKGVSIPCSA